MDVRWLTVNVPSVVSVVATGVFIAMYVQSLASRVDQIEKTRQERSIAIDKGFDQIVAQMQPPSNLPYRVGVLEQGLLATKLQRR